MAVDAAAADLARMYRETRERLTALVAGLDEAELGTPVPACPGWSVADVAGHLAAIPEDALSRVQALERRRGPEYLRSMVPPGTPRPDSLPSVFRASDDDREDVIRMLRDGSVAGRLSHDTFLRRVDRALRARRRDELAGLLSDLPLAPDERAGPGYAAKPWSRLTDPLRSVWLRSVRFRGPWPAARLPRLVLPRGPRTVFTIGRSPDCDLPLGDITVSWRHAELRRTGQAWVLVDLGSKNGTRVNGWRADSGFTVHAGDWVSFGAAAFRLADPA